MTDRAALFNPPPASEWAEADYSTPERTAHRLKRKVIAPIKRRRRHSGPNSNNTESMRYYRACARERCHEELECHRVVTGTHQHDSHGHVPLVEDVVYYWPDDALVLETSNWSNRLVQVPFCSFKCMSLWAAQNARTHG